MPTSILAHVAISFALGAAAGGGVIAALSRKRESPKPAAASPSNEVQKPIMDIGPWGARMSDNAIATAPALKFGSPGVYTTPNVIR